MIRYIIRRLLWAVVLFLAVTVVTYIIFFVIPADPAQQLAGRAAQPRDIKRVAHYWHLDQPVPLQYYYFLRRLVVEQSLGRSFANREDVNKIIAPALKAMTGPSAHQSTARRPGGGATFIAGL